MSTEFANKATDTYETGKTINYFNGAPRFRCNNQLSNATPSTYEITNITDAKNTYAELYKIYNENNNKGTPVNKDTFGSNTHCVMGDSGKCPYNPNNLNSTPTTNTNVLAYTKDGTNSSLLVKDLKFYLDDCGARIRDYDMDPNNTSTASYKPVLDYATGFRDGSYNTLVKTRSDLDNKMNEILGNNKNSILYEKQGELDATVYSTLLWTVMVTSLLYYVFTKI